MAVLSAAKRRALPSSTFAGPDRSYPIPDKNHAKAALALINKGGLSPEEKAKVRARAHKMLGGMGAMSSKKDTESRRESRSKNEERD